MGAEYRLMYLFHRLGALHGFVRERRRQGKIGYRPQARQRGFAAPLSEVASFYALIIWSD